MKISKLKGLGISIDRKLDNIYKRSKLNDYEELLMFHVKKRTLLLIAGIVWLIAGFNVARLGVLSYRVIESKWYLYVLTVVVFSIFGMMFFKMSKKHTKRIMGYEATRPLWHFFDLKAYMIMACMGVEELDLEQLEFSQTSLSPSFIQD